jgi:hypothetical protein
MASYLAGFLAIIGACLFAHAAEPPAIPVGLDAYRLWDRWPQLRIGARAYMRSTYDRRGGNEGADASHFLYQLAEDRNVTLDLQGPGILYFARYNHWHGSPWHFEVDGRDHIIGETSTADPNHPSADSVFLPIAPFPNPLSWTWSQTRGADLSWTPIPFETSFRMAYSRTHYGTGYYIYHQYVPGTKLSQSIRSWNEKTIPARDVLDLISKSGSPLLPDADSPTGRKMGLKRILGQARVSNQSTQLLARLVDGPGEVRALGFSAARHSAIDLGRLRLRIYWDDNAEPSVDAPLALFHGTGTFYNRDNREYLVKAFPVNVHFSTDQIHLACYFPMPFFRSARFELVNPSEDAMDLDWSICTAPLTGPPELLGYFHATYRDHPHPEAGRDLVLLDTREAEGGGEWSGHLVGTAWIFSNRAVLNTLEGDPRFFFDDSQTPQAQGTGTEEWGGGGDYWGGLNMTLPFAGHPTGAKNLKEAKNEEDQIESAYRFLLADLMPFGRNALIRLEHGGQNESTEHYQTVTFWYGRHGATLRKSDELKIGNAASEQTHEYASPAASAPYEISSRYEWGVDTANGREIYPAQTDVGRKTSGVSEFNLKLDATNVGVMLRRKLDYRYPNQRAQISVAESRNGMRRGSFKPAGIWYLAGSSTCVYSNPKGEMDPAQHIIETSNRAFRDDEFLLPLALTRGCSEIRVRVKFTPVPTPLFPGQSLPELAWTELQYEAWCFLIPK